MTACLFYAIAGTSATDILSVVSVSIISVEASSSVIFSYSDSASKSFL